jgi:hypothetical protein
MSYTDDLFKVVGISTNPYPSVWDEDKDECGKTSFKRHSKKFEVKLTDYGEFISPKRNIMTKEKQLTTKIVNCIKFHLCKQDEDYDKPIISPKFLADTLDQMMIDGFEVETEK